MLGFKLNIRPRRNCSIVVCLHLTNQPTLQEECHHVAGHCTRFSRQLHSSCPAVVPQIQHLHQTNAPWHFERSHCVLQLIWGFCVIRGKLLEDFSSKKSFRRSSTAGNCAAETLNLFLVAKPPNFLVEPECFSSFTFDSMNCRSCTIWRIVFYPMKLTWKFVRSYIFHWGMHGPSISTKLASVWMSNLFSFSFHLDRILQRGYWCELGCCLAQFRKTSAADPHFFWNLIGSSNITWQ